MTDKIDCDQTDDRTHDDADLAKLGGMINALGFHGVIMLAKPCAKCNRLHQWRMITTLPPDEGGVQEVLRYSARMMDAGTPEAFIINRGDAQ